MVKKFVLVLVVVVCKPISVLSLDQAEQYDGCTQNMFWKEQWKLTKSNSTPTMYFAYEIGLDKSELNYWSILQLFNPFTVHYVHSEGFLQSRTCLIINHQSKIEFWA